MKKILVSLFVMGALHVSAQKTINIFNYTSLNLINFLGAGDQSSPNCYPLITGGHHPVPVPPMGAVSYNGYYNSHLQNPPIDRWDVILSLNNGSVQPATSPVLMALGSATDWMFSKFTVEDPNGTPLPYSGETIGTTGCNLPIITHLQKSVARPYPFSDAFWFVSAGQTYFVIQ
ncbi:hypothetical protein SAMN05421786_10568 [Chryseobacterium ureilyticum]|uniref:Uncharacterized protein n=1 Tax=Chryseobacterium ureilyticum TaxID=373668 RepID=A0A1N7PD88_9FLAO|nr:hypothetical protein [Chryseobacterium ureilyticum]SIT08506.1 hypothetical protein SAMN05421786_10568 [Chryseobacterium ureilyticum]